MEIGNNGKVNITVLMSTYNGEKYLDEQLKSIFEQIGVNVKVFVRDDGSTDNTVKILEEWEKNNALEWYSGPNIGVGNSFMELVYNADESNYYAFSDQDDVWDNNKIVTGIKLFDGYAIDKPLLYHCEYRITDNKLKFIKNSSVKKYNYFGSALIENKAIGCSIIFNHCAKKLAEKFIQEDIFIHDAWLYRICYAVGDVIYDKEVHFSYRQHDNNVVGERLNTYHKWLDRYKRINVLKGQKINTIRQVNRCVFPFIEDFPKKRTIKELTEYDDNLKSKFRVIFNKRIRMESGLDTLLFKALILFSKA